MNLRVVDQSGGKIFGEEILQSENKFSHYNVFSIDEYADLINQVEDADKLEKRTSLQKRRLKRFAVLIIGDVKNSLHGVK